MIDDKIDKYLTEKKTPSYDKEIKDISLTLTGEIESLIDELIKDWWDNNGWSFNDGKQMDKSDRVKALNLAIKKINIKKIDV